MTSGVAQGIWQGLPLTHVTTAFHASRTSQFVYHCILGNHCGFTLMLYHESLRDHAKASITKHRKSLQSSVGEALLNLVPTPPILLAGFGLSLQVVDQVSWCPTDAVSVMVPIGGCMQE